jgi:hypothetical protein
MKRRASGPRLGKSGLEVLEEATQLLRTCPAGALVSYYVGAVPFVLCLLFFWADMSRSPFADQHLTSNALGLAGLFVWMKFWQVLFVRRLWAKTCGTPVPSRTFKQSVRIFLIQAAWQPLGLFLLPLALVLTVPFGWVFAFFENLTVLCDGEEEPRPLVKESIRQAVLWPGQNHILLGLLSGFGCIVFLNWATLLYILPNLVKMLLGSESMFTRSSTSLLNTTFFATMLGLSYLSVDPLVRAVYVLRCFYGKSLESGEDLKTDLKQFALPVRQIAVLLAALVLFGMTLAPPAASAQPNKTVLAGSVTAPPSTASVPAAELDNAIQSVAQKSKYAWRMPREKTVGTDKSRNGFLDRFLDRLGTMVRDWLRSLGNWLDRVLRKLFSRQTTQPPGSSGYGWIMVQELLPYLLIGAAAVCLGYIAYRVWRNRHCAVQPVAILPVPLDPDLADESLGAAHLPEDGWTKLGRELLARGELRLALRAFYLASLAQLAQRNLISLAKFKSNRDYLLELQRRAHSFPDLLNLFGHNIAVFDRTWYGLHQATTELVTQFAANVERMRTAP